MLTVLTIKQPNINNGTQGNSGKCVDYVYHLDCGDHITCVGLFLNASSCTH